MSLTTSACGNAQDGQKVTLGDDDFHIYTLYIPSGSKHDIKPLKAMLVVLNISELTPILPNNTPVHFHAVAYPPPTTYVQSDDDWDLILTVMSYDLQPLDSLPTSTAGEPISLTFKISGPIVHSSHEGEACLLIDACPEDYWLVGTPMTHLSPSFKDYAMVGRYAHATAIFAHRGRTSDKSKALLMFDLSMAQIFDPQENSIQTFRFYTNPPHDNSLIHRLTKQAPRRYASALAEAAAAQSRLEVIPSSVPSEASSSPPPTPGLQIPQDQPPELLQVVLRCSPRLKKLGVNRRGSRLGPSSFPAVTASLLSRLSAELGSPHHSPSLSKRSVSTRFISSTSKGADATLKVRRSKTPARKTKRRSANKTKSSAQKTGRSRSTGRAKAVTIAPLRLLRSAIQRGKLRSSLL